MAASRKKIIGNFMSLSFQQGISIIFPLLVLPYLVRVLGISGFGIFTLIQTAILYIDLLIAFGFNLTATHRIAKAANDIALQKQIITAVYFIKLVMFVACITIALLCTIFIPYLQQHILLILFAALYLAGNLLFPEWYFQGIQQMRNCTVVTLVSKFISLVLIILWVKHPGDIDIAFFALATGNLLAGFIGVGLLLKTIKPGFRLPDKIFIQQLFKESSYVFVSIILVPLYSSLNIFILQLFASPLVVGSYSVAQKIFNAASMITNVVSNTFFPHLSQLYITSVKEYKRNINRLVILLGSGFLVLSVIQFFGASLIIELLAGSNKTEDISYAVLLLKIISFALVFSPFVSFFFQQMIIQHQHKQSVKNILIAVVVNLISATVLAYYWGGVGMSVNVCLVTMLICFLNRHSVYKNLQLQVIGQNTNGTK